jgi:hypothetical protein
VVVCDPRRYFSIASARRRASAKESPVKFDAVVAQHAPILAGATNADRRLGFRKVWRRVGRIEPIQRRVRHAAFSFCAAGARE